MIGDRIRIFREKMGLTQDQLAKIIHLSQQSIDHYEKGRAKPGIDTVNSLADLFNTTVDYLVGRIDNSKPFDQINTTFVPILGQIKMGIPILAQDNWGGELEIPSDIRADFALEAHGDSMIGVGFLDGDYAICREAQTAHSGDVVVGLQRTSSETSDATLKFYFREKDRQVLRAANPNYEDIVMDEDWYIGGVLVGILRKGSPAYRVYNSYLAARDINEEKWDPVFERASQLGIKPEQVMSMIETMHQIMKGN